MSMSSGIGIAGKLMSLKWLRGGSWDMSLRCSKISAVNKNNSVANCTESLVQYLIFAYLPMVARKNFRTDFLLLTRILSEVLDRYFI